MQNSKDAFKLDFNPSGVEYSKVTKDHSVSYLNKLLENKLIRIDNRKRVYLTDRGRVARKIGVEKYLQLEKFEKELRDDHSEEGAFNKFILMVIWGILIFLASFVLLYLSWSTDFQ